jgi:putative salt-induced outer membrane protein YdiY
VFQWWTDCEQQHFGEINYRPVARVAAIAANADTNSGSKKHKTYFRLTPRTKTSPAFASKDSSLIGPIDRDIAILDLLLPVVNRYELREFDYAFRAHLGEAIRTASVKTTGLSKRLQMTTWTDNASMTMHRIPCQRVLATISFVVVLVVFSVDTHGQDASEVPSWMNGNSTWTGDGYHATTSPSLQPSSDLSIKMPSNVPTVNPYATDASTPYSVPSDPYATSAAPAPGIAKYDVTAANATIANAEQVGETTKQAVAELATASNNEVAQVAHQAAQTLGSQMGQAMSFERPPLIEESIRWYQYPWRWMTQGWTNSIELGLDGSQGNAETLALQTGAELKRKTDAYTLAFDFDYRLVNTRDVVTEDNGRFNIDYDRLLGDSPWSLFGKFGLEWDEFKAFDLRLNLNSGIGYHWIRNDRTTFVTRFGAGASREIGAPDDDWVPEAVFGFDAEHQVNKRNKLKAKLDYFPSWEDFSDYRIVSDASWEILLRDDDSLSLKMAVTDRYDSTPQGGNKANDVYYSLLLLVKF